MVVGGRRFAVAAEVETFLGRFFGLGGDYGGEEDAIARDDWRGPATAGDIQLPGDVGGGGPGVREGGVFGYAGRGSSELRPGILGQGGAREEKGEIQDGGLRGRRRPGACPTIYFLML